VTFRLRHEWPTEPRRVLSAELVSCPHCGTLRVTEAGRPTRYLRRVSEEAERDREDEPPCLEPPTPRQRARAPRDKIGCELGPRARERGLRALDPEPEEG
jgi:hypothetical protein